jgi:4-amino-4-deoxy-L-arabinose transferase-like glycosyltransferase
LPNIGLMKFHVSFVRMGCLLAVLALAALGGYLALNGALNSDEGFYLLASRLVSEGYRPYADFGYTQGPVLPYVNVPWLAVFGYSLAGVRLASLGWTLIAVIAGVWTLRRRAGWIAATIFAVLLLGSPVWMQFAVQGKTYGFTGMAVLAGAIALTSRGPLGWRWAAFIAAAALGTGARYPTAGFFLPAGVGLLLLTPGWRARVWAVLATTAGAVALLAWAAAGDWGGFFYWTAGFHAKSTFVFSRGEQFWYFLLFAPALWVAAGLTAGRLTGGDRSTRFAYGALLLGLMANLAGHTTYAEYVFPLVPAVAFVVAPALTEWSAKMRGSVAVPLAVALLACAWIHPPELNRELLRHARDASAFLQAQVGPHDVVACSMPEIPAASGHPVPLTLAMGKFGRRISMRRRRRACTCSRRPRCATCCRTRRRRPW